MSRVKPLLNKERLKRWLLKLLIKTKRIKSVSFSADELNDMLAANLPEQFSFPVPGSKGELELQQATISMPRNNSHLEVSLFCAVRIDSMANPIYRAHVEILGTALPAYDEVRKVVHLHNIQLGEMRIVQDEYALIEDTKHLITMFVPSPLKSVFGATVKTTLNLLSNGTYKEVQTYLSLYLEGSKSKVLEYHRPELEKIIVELTESGDLEYSLDETILEERLFAELGKKVEVRDGALHFVFH